MREYLKYYQVTMRTLAPVFVGSGKEIGKKEYIFLNKSKVGIPDIQKLYAEMRKRGLGSHFEDYLLSYSWVSLTDWLKRQNIRMNEIEPIINYKLDCGDAVLERGGNRLKVMECIKDPYGKPYIPGSSLKGMFRTIFLGADMLRSAKKYGREKEIFQQNMEEKKKQTYYYLKKEMESLEGVAFRTLQREKTRPRDAVNDILQGFVVSDSDPLSVDDLVLCQKIDWHTNGIERKIPILRECIKPNITIRFNITVNTQICSITKEKILEAVKDF
ncbi:MAG: type III-A CRISPR-associated RAMP protein Csm5, partial [Lachnospiraceae bacterium]|nr:type III-A CRISPR-associated RAMP protein Csm5 [Lachnospiraceae bacterium]